MEKLKNNKQKANVLSYNIHYSKFKKHEIFYYKKVILYRYKGNGKGIKVSEETNVSKTELNNFINLLKELNNLIQTGEGYYYSLIF